MAKTKNKLTKAKAQEIAKNINGDGVKTTVVKTSWDKNKWALLIEPDTEK